MYYREDLMSKVGYDHAMLENLNWEGYLELGRKLKTDLGLHIDALTPESTALFQMLLWLAGGSYTNKIGDEITLDDGIAVDVMTKIKGMFDEELLAPMGAGSNAWWTAAREGKVPAVWNATWFGGYFHRHIEKAEDGMGLWRNVQLPELEPGGARAVNRGGSPLEIPAHSKNPDLAWEVSKFTMATVEGALACMATGTVLNWLPALQTKEFKEKPFPYAGDWHINELWARYATDVPNTFYYTPVWPEADKVLGAWHPQIVKGELSVENGLKSAADEVRKVNEKWIRIMEQE
jgi:maltose-binding protein MalE